MFQPAFRALLYTYPAAQIDLIVGKESQSRAMLERLMEMEVKKFNQIFEADYKSLSISKLRELNRKLRDQRYDLAVCTYMSPSPYFTSAIANVPIRVGHSLPWDKWYKPRLNRLFNVSVRLAQDHEHETSRHYRLIRELIGDDGVMPTSSQIVLRKSEEEFASVFWEKHELQDRIIIGTHFGASKAQHWKKWDDERFAEVLLTLIDKYNPIFLHFGVSNEEDQIQEASKHAGRNSIFLAGELGIFEVAALLQRCSAFLGNDSGVGHIAMAVGTPSLRVFGMSDYWGYRSLDPKHTDIFKDIWCSPCLQLGYLKSYNVHNCGHKNCMKLIAPSEVVEGFSQLILPK